MTTLKGLAHIAIFTENLEKSLAFYQALGGTGLRRSQVQKPEGINQLALLDWAGFTLEFIEPHDGTVMTKEEGAIPHIALTVEDLDAAIAEVRAAGVDSFLTSAPIEMKEVFGGLRNIFFQGPDGEKIELLQML